MTALDGKIIKNQEDEEIYEKLKKPFENDKNINITSVIGQDYRRKICYCSTTDVFIANGGTGCMVPLKFCEKPGVLHSNTSLWAFGEINTTLVKSTDSSITLDSKTDNTNTDMSTSYSIPWEHIFNLLADVLQEIKDIKIKRLKVPNLNDLENKYKKENLRLNAFKELEENIKSGKQSADILREIAYHFERNGDIYTALKIMEEALCLRPNGPVINQKIAEYKEILSKETKE
jgi:tetratricopeptide (TPR) repeat protein